MRVGDDIDEKGRRLSDAVAKTQRGKVSRIHNSHDESGASDRERSARYLERKAYLDARVFGC